MNLTETVVDSANIISLVNHSMTNLEFGNENSETLEVEELGVSFFEQTLPLESRRLVSEINYPEESMFILYEQLKSLKNSLGRIKFYIEDLEDLVQT